MSKYTSLLSTFGLCAQYKRQYDFLMSNSSYLYYFFNEQFQIYKQHGSKVFYTRPMESSAFGNNKTKRKQNGREIEGILKYIIKEMTSSYEIFFQVNQPLGKANHVQSLRIHTWENWIIRFVPVFTTALKASVAVCAGAVSSQSTLPTPQFRRRLPPPSSIPEPDSNTNLH